MLLKMEKELIHEVENKLVEIVGRSNVYVKASPIPDLTGCCVSEAMNFYVKLKRRLREVISVAYK